MNSHSIAADGNRPQLFIAANRLPVYIATADGKLTLRRSIGGLATALEALARARPVVWVGWAGNSRPLSPRQRAQLQIPPTLAFVDIPIRMLERYYTRLANGVLWPVMHSMEPRVADTPDDWEAMHAAVSRFAQVIKERCKPADIIWVHDYHLLLLVGALRDLGLRNKIGFFLHTPFPRPEIFGGITQYRQLLKSLIGADLIGLQTVRDVQNFRNCLADTRLQLRHETTVAAFPIGLDYQAYHDARKRPAVRSLLAALRAEYAGKQVVLSISRLDYTKGIIDQLRAFELAVTQHEARDVVYRLVVAPSREARREYRALERQIERVVTAINDRFAAEQRSATVSFEYRNHSFDEVNAWYRLADVLLITPFIDGMNLVAKEYIAARTRPGMLVLSNTAGAADQLTEAVLVPPKDPAAIAAGLSQALTMPSGEKQRRWAQLQQSVRTQDVFWWSDAFVTALTGRKQ